MDQRKIHAKGISNIRRSLRTTRIRGDNNTILHPATLGHDLMLDVLAQQMSAVQIVYGNVEEALVLRVVQVHGDDVIGTGAGEKVGDKGAGLCDPLPVAALGTEVRGLRMVMMAVVGVMRR
jgi:hypothetical protein